MDKIGAILRDVWQSLERSMTTILGVNWKPRASAVLLGLIVNLADIGIEGGLNKAVVLVTISSAIRSFLVKSHDVSNSPVPGIANQVK